ncbi:hypothetical protein PP338_00740 [Mycobacteroides abscessus]|nr:hypothetical protein [Mycobacteroides abscessus]MDM2078757.1 hypothetical protein [Mycobacteroides abscessus]
MSSIAIVLSLLSLGWQVKLNWWDRPHLVLEDERVAAEFSSGRLTGWSARVMVSNTGNAETQLLAVLWEFERESGSSPSIHVLGSISGPEMAVEMTQSPELQLGKYRQILPGDRETAFQPTVLGRNHSRTYEFELAPIALDSLKQCHRARPVAQFVDRKRRFGPKRHGVGTAYGTWCITPRNAPPETKR